MNSPKLRIWQAKLAAFVLTLMNISVALYVYFVLNDPDILLISSAIYFCITFVLLIIAEKKLQKNHKDTVTANKFAKMLGFYFVFLIILIMVLNMFTSIKETKDFVFGVTTFNLFASLGICLWFLIRVEKYELLCIKMDNKHYEELFLRQFSNRNVTSEFNLAVNKESNGADFQLFQKSIAIIDQSVFVIKQDPLIVIHRDEIDSIETTPLPFLGMPYISLRTKDSRELKLCFHEFPPIKIYGGGGEYKKRYHERLLILENRLKKSLSIV